MKKFIFAVAAMLMTPTVANAQGVALCPKIGDLAGSIMKARQLDVPKSTVIAVLLSKDPQVAKLTMSLVDLAYSTPVYPTEEMQSTAIESFHNQAEYICYKNFTY